MEEDIKIWTRRLTGVLARLDDPPARVEARLENGGLEVSLWPESGAGLVLHFGSDSMQYRGSELDERGACWIEAIERSLERTRRLPGWRDFLTCGSVHTDPVSSGDWWLIRLTERCNATCAFCSAVGTTPDLATSRVRIERRLELGRSRGQLKLSITGGEPTLLRRLPAWIERARELGYREVDLQTNGLLLDDPGRLDQLSRAGLSSVFLSLHSHRPEVHDAMLSVDGAFDRAFACARYTQRSGLMLGINVVLTRYNKDDLHGLISLIAARLDPARCHVNLSYCSPQGRALEHLDLLVPLFDLAPRLEAALDEGAGLGLDMHVPGICGVPMCSLPAHLKYFDEFHAKSPAHQPERIYPELCSGCGLRARCSGFWRVYLERFGPAGLGAQRLV
ncbi:MAG: radical SAM protein [Deltaproteobacteria bacterium]|nr:radical SAM protein [Deltaproteobacteria bacterium]